MNINLFIEQMGIVLEKTPEKLGKFQFDEFEVHADITAQGTIAVLGSGVQEFALAAEYAAFAKKCADRWPRTAAILRDIERKYKGEGRWHKAREEFD